MHELKHWKYLVHQIKILSQLHETVFYDDEKEEKIKSIIMTPLWCWQKSISLSKKVTCKGFQPLKELRNRNSNLFLRPPQNISEILTNILNFLFSKQIYTLTHQTKCIYVEN